MTQTRLLELARVGLQQELNELSQLLSATTPSPTPMPAATAKKPGRPKTNPEAPASGKRKRILSPESRARIAEAQKRRWAKTPPTVAPEPTMAPEPVPAEA